MQRWLALALVMLAPLAMAHAEDGAFEAPRSAARAPRFADHVLDCAAHGAWTAPEGWSVSRTDDGDVLAIEPRGRAILIRAQTRTRTTHVRTTADFVRIASEIASRWAPGAALGDVVEHARSRWHVDRRVEGTATVSGTAMRVVAESRGERQLWVAVFPTSPPELGASIEAAMASFLSLTDHACQCGYDCDRRAAPTP